MHRVPSAGFVGQTVHINKTVMTLGRITHRNINGSDVELPSTTVGWVISKNLLNGEVQNIVVKFLLPPSSPGRLPRGSQHQFTVTDFESLITFSENQTGTLLIPRWLMRQLEILCNQAFTSLVWSTGAKWALEDLYLCLLLASPGPEHEADEIFGVIRERLKDINGGPMRIGSDDQRARNARH